MTESKTENDESASTFYGAPMTPEQMEALVLYRDGLMLVLNKPPGLPVHQGPSKGDNLERYFDALRYGFPKPPSLAHRLDRDTTGCLVLGRHPKALRRLGRIFTTGHVGKTYWGLVRGRMPEPRGRIELPLLKRNDKTGWSIVVDEAGQEAVTDYQVLGEAGGLSWVAFSPRTGRTHQIRVHTAALGCPIAGDPFYGGATDDDPLPYHCLHAQEISVPLYYPKRPPIVVTAPPPAHMIAGLTACRYHADPAA